MNTFKVHILSAHRTFYEGPCESLVIPAVDGQYGVLAGHSNTITALVPGRLTFRAPGEEEVEAAVSAGIMKIENNDVLVLAEYGFSAYSDSRGTFNLYVYVWNPQRISYNLRSELNTIELGVSADGTYTTYEKYALEFLNASDEAGYAGVFYKFKLALTAAQKENIASSFTGEERFYHVAGIELLQSNASNATDYNVNKEYIYKGYAAGYGADPEAESSLSFRQDVGTTLELDVHSTAYRTEGNNGVNSHTQDSLHSVYFAVPNDVIEE